MQPLALESVQSHMIVLVFDRLVAVRSFRVENCNNLHLRTLHSDNNIERIHHCYCSALVLEAVECSYRWLDALNNAVVVLSVLVS